jgi:hypothetical protein
MDPEVLVRHIRVPKNRNWAMAAFIVVGVVRAT